MDIMARFLFGCAAILFFGGGFRALENEEYIYRIVKDSDYDADMRTFVRAACESTHPDIYFGLSLVSLGLALRRGPVNCRTNHLPPQPVQG